MRFIVLSSGCFSLCMGLLSLFAGAESPMLMHRQGRNVANVLTKASY